MALWAFEDGLLPHGFCFQWNQSLVWLHASSDALIAAAYFSIPISLFRIVQKKRSLPFTWMFLLFGSFIAACGTTHLLEALTLWVPIYWVSGFAKLCTVVASWLTAGLLVHFSPHILAMSTPEEMAAINEKLRHHTDGLRISEERFRLMAENVQEIFWVLDPETLEATYVSPAFERICERPLDSIRLNPSSYRDIIHPDDAERVLDKLRTLAVTNRMEEEFRILCPDGKTKWVFANGSPARNAEGRIVALVGTTLDVTPRMIIEQVLRENEDRYRDLVEHSRDLICTHDLQGNLLSINELPAKILGYSREEILSKSLREFIPPEFQSDFDQYLSVIKRKGEATGLFSVMTKSGERRIWKYYNTLRTERVAQPIVRGVAHDVTEQKQAERALRFSEEKFSKAFRNSPIDMAITTLDGGVFVDVNETFERQTGFSRNEVIGKSVLELDLWVDPEQRVRLLQEIRVRHRIPSCEVQFRTKSGSFQTKLYSAEAIEIGGKKCLLAVCEDITQRKVAEKALLESEARYRSLFLNMPCGMCRVDLDGTLVLANDALVQMLGYESRDELLSRNMEKDIYARPSERHAVVESVREHNSLKGIEVHLKRRDGNQILARAHVKAVKNTIGETIALEAIVEDITQQRKLEEQLQQAQKMESIALMAGGIAHDFNNILTGVLGYGQLALKRLKGALSGKRCDLPVLGERWPEDLQKTLVQLQQIVDAAEHGRSLTGQLLAFSHEEAVPVYPFNLDSEIQQIHGMISRLIGEHIDVQLLLECATETVLGERGAFGQVLMNLCVNARDAMLRGGRLTIHTFASEIQQSLKENSGIPAGRYIVLDVSDTGCGMDKELREHIFEPFFTTKAPGHGTGLGLYTVYVIVHRCGGHIRVYSERGRGTQFRLYFPVVGTVTVSQSNAASERHDSISDGLVLVVEDDERVRDLIQAQLEDFGFDVVSEASAVVAMKRYAEHKNNFKMLVTDVVMPGLNGPDLARQLKRSQPDLKILYVTGWAPADILPCEALGEHAELLRKPFTEYELNRTIRHLLSQTSH
jgi:two-component system cell cycle sensor histidine kinase/response regulator CckA